MGGIPQLIGMLLVALGILLVMFLLAFLTGKLFKEKRTRKRIMLGTIAVYLVICMSYFGFIAFVFSGNVN